MLEIHKASGIRYPFVHKLADVEDRESIGQGTQVWRFAHVMAGATVGEDCILGNNVFVQEGVTIGNRVKIQNNVSVYKGVTLEDDVFCGPSCVFTNVRNPRAHVNRKDALSQTLVRKGATLGANCTIVCGVTIGEYAFVAAGSVVTKDVPHYALVMGNPAKFVGYMCKCGEKAPPSTVFEQWRHGCDKCEDA
jgi:UDP-2-acetamido-3-amino-2,3-dideoxy-glucuronate N-acetyltransferase